MNIFDICAFALQAWAATKVRIVQRSDSTWWIERIE